MRKLVLALLVLAAGSARAGGGLVLANDTCILTVGFYEAHFTAYQPETGGDTEYCDELPETGPTIIVLDYLHASLAEVPVEIVIIENTTGKGEFARLEDVQTLDEADVNRIFHQPPVVRSNGSLTIEHAFATPGEYIGIVTAGHPTSDATYTNVFTFSVGLASLPWGLIGLAAAILVLLAFLLQMKRIGRAPAGNES